MGRCSCVLPVTAIGCLTLGAIATGAATPLISGTVLGPSGEPAPGAEVGIAAWRRVDELESILTNRADQGGAFRVTAPEEQGPFAVYARDKAQDWIGVTYLPEDAPLGDPVEVRLTKAGYIRTHAVTRDEAPLPGVRVRVQLTFDAEDYRAWALPGPESDGNGLLLVGPLPCGVRLGLEPPVELALLTVDEVWQSQANSSIVLRPGQTYTVAPQRFDPEGRSVAGQVVDDGGQPVPGASVLAFLPATARPVTEANADGEFRLAGLALRGRAWIGAASPDRRLCAAFEVDPDAPEPLTLLVRPLASVEGRVTDPEGRPLVGATAHAFAVGTQDDGGSFFWGDVAQFPKPPRVRADDEGGFVLQGLVHGGPYRLSVDSPQMYVFDPADTAFIPDAERPIDLGTVRPAG